MNETDRTRLDGRVAVVTAGCAGLGHDIAERLAALGATVVATSRRAEAVEQHNAAGAAGGIEARRLVFEDAEVDAFFAGIAADHGRIDVLVNAAARRSPGTSVDDLSAEVFLAELEAGLVSGFLCSRSALKHAGAPGLSSIVNIGSIYGVFAVDHRIYDDPARQTPLSYACAKAGLVQMTRYLAALWADRGVRVNCVSVGGVRHQQDPKFQARYGERVPMGRMAEPREVADAVAFLAAPASGYITGENLMLDGGLHAW